MSVGRYWNFELRCGAEMLSLSENQTEPNLPTLRKVVRKFAPLVPWFSGVVTVFGSLMTAYGWMNGLGIVHVPQQISEQIVIVVICGMLGLSAVCGAFAGFLAYLFGLFLSGWCSRPNENQRSSALGNQCSSAPAKRLSPIPPIPFPNPWSVQARIRISEGRKIFAEMHKRDKAEWANIKLGEPGWFRLWFRVQMPIVLAGLVSCAVTALLTSALVIDFLGNPQSYTLSNDYFFLWFAPIGAILLVGGYVFFGRQVFNQLRSGRA